MKINVDASSRQGNDWIGARCVIRYDDGNFVRARAIVLRGGKLYLCTSYNSKRSINSS